MSFVHAWKTTEFSDTDLELLTRHCIVQFDKRQFTYMNNVSLEDRLIAAGKQVKAYNPDVKTLMYMNGLLNFGSTRLYDVTAADPTAYLLQNTTGDFVMTNKLTTFDMRKSAMRQLFVEDALYGLQNGGFDGVFIDRANFGLKLKAFFDVGQTSAGNQVGWDTATLESMIPAQRTLLTDLLDALTDKKMVLAKESVVAGSKDWQVANAAMVKDAFCSSYKRASTRSFDKDTCLEQILFVQKVSRRPMLTQLHAAGPGDDVAAREFTMACFLVAAGNLSYFSYVNWDHMWDVAGVNWWPEYDKPLGEPLDVAVRDGWRFSREFASGTQVSVDLESQTANISWASRQLVV